MDVGWFNVLPGDGSLLDVEVELGALPNLLDLLHDNDLPMVILDGNDSVVGSLTSDGLVTQLLELLLGSNQTLEILDGIGTPVGEIQVDDLVAALLGTTTEIPLLDTNGSIIGTLVGDGLLEGLLNDLLGGLLGGILGGDKVLEFADIGGTVIGTLPAQDILDLLNGVTNNATTVLRVVVDSVVDPLIDPVAAVLDTPLITVGGVTASQALAPVVITQNNTANANQRPNVRIKKSKIRKAQMVAIVRGTATDLDGVVRRVEVRNKGQRSSAKGKSSWQTKMKLKEGRNRIVVQATDDDGAKSRRLVRVIRVAR